MMSPIDLTVAPGRQIEVRHPGEHDFDGDVTILVTDDHRSGFPELTVAICLTENEVWELSKQLLGAI